MKPSVFLLSVLLILMTSCASRKHRRAERVEADKNGVQGNTEAAEVRESRVPGEPRWKRALPKDDGVFREFRIGSVEEYIEEFAGLAQDEMIAYGIPASITLAQGILESGAGMGKLAQKSNNHFGIKCHTEWVGPRVYHDDDERGECFRKYNHPRYSFRDHSEFLYERARYSFLFDYRRNDYRSWAHGLKKAGYATDPRYPDKLISLIRRYELDKYDSRMIDLGLPVERPRGDIQTRTYEVRQGDTLYRISQLYKVTVEQIKEWNGLSSDEIDIGQLLKIKVEQR